MGRQSALIVLGLVAIIGVAAVLIRLLRARKHGISLRMQVFLAVATITAVISASFGVVVMERFESRAVVLAIRAVEDDARVVAGLVTRTAEGMGVPMKEVAAVLSRPPSLAAEEALEETRVQIVDRGGAVVFDSAAVGGAAPAAPGAEPGPELEAALRGEVGDNVGVRGGKAVAAAPIFFAGAVSGAVFIERSVIRSTSVVEETATNVALLGLLLACAAALAGLVIGHSVAGPLVRLTRAAETIASGEHQGPLPEPRGREVRALTHAFEGMRAELEERSVVEALAADLSHSLKNPVASIRAAAEVLGDLLGDASAGAGEDREAARRFVARVQESALRVDALVRDLLSLAKLEARGPIRGGEQVDLVDLARASVRSMAPQASLRKVAIELSAPEELYARADAAWLGRALENLLANALAAAPAGTTVNVEVAGGDESCQIRVVDRGAGVPAEVRERLFERFVTTRSAEGGSGLGLSIVRAVAEAHGGRAELTRSQPGETVFTVELPV